MNAFFTVEHSGTHLDAPAHLKRGAWKVHQVPMDHLIGPGVIINVTVGVVLSEFRFIFSAVKKTVRNFLAHIETFEPV